MNSLRTLPFFVFLYNVFYCDRVLGQSLHIDDPSSLVQCQPVSITWTGGQAPYEVSLSRAGNPSSIDEVLGSVSGTPYTWTVDVDTGLIAICLKDSTGRPDCSSLTNVQAGDTSCMRGSPSPDPTTPTTTSPPSPNTTTRQESSPNTTPANGGSNPSTTSSNDSGGNNGDNNGSSNGASISNTPNNPSPTFSRISSNGNGNGSSTTLSYSGSGSSSSPTSSGFSTVRTSEAGSISTAGMGTETVTGSRTASAVIAETVNVDKSESDDSESINIAAIVGGVVGGVVLTILIVIFLLWCCRRRKQPRKTDPKVIAPFLIDAARTETNQTAHPPVVAASTWRSEKLEIALKRKEELEAELRRLVQAEADPTSRSEPSQTRAVTVARSVSARSTSSDRLSTLADSDTHLIPSSTTASRFGETPSENSSSSGGRRSRSARSGQTIEEMAEQMRLMREQIRELQAMRMDTVEEDAGPLWPPPDYHDYRPTRPDAPPATP